MTADYFLRLAADEGLAPGAEVFVATDELQRQWFEPFAAAGYTPRFVEDLPQAPLAEAGHLLAPQNPFRVRAVRRLSKRLDDDRCGLTWGAPEKGRGRPAGCFHSEAFRAGGVVLDARLRRARLASGRAHSG